MSGNTLIDAVPGPFKRQDFKIVDGNGRKIATVATSVRVPTEIIEGVGDLLASSWDLRELLRHVLACSGSPTNCKHCKVASELAGRGM